MALEAVHTSTGWSLLVCEEESALLSYLSYMALQIVQITSMINKQLLAEGKQNRR
jgi:hypothetical protein